MSIKEKINAMETATADIYDAIVNKGGDSPTILGEDENLTNMARAIESIPLEVPQPSNNGIYYRTVWSDTEGVVVPAGTVGYAYYDEYNEVVVTSSPAYGVHTYNCFVLAKCEYDTPGKIFAMRYLNTGK